ncbi:MAG: hypothetical protein J6B00_03105 [Alphaproteobacteria bacterium]|nr:hypothetical protein [Alphaproteobacteria bacterium]MBO5284845.1 hypothetical protein [Alphaproteobacteria bacterium]
MAKQRRRKRLKKLIRVLKRKWAMPAFYTLCASYIIYVLVSSTVTTREKVEQIPPRFIITRLSDTFEETEFMHLLLTIQEISTSQEAAQELKTFVNKPFPSPSPKLLEHRLNLMNWEPKAFHIRVQKMFAMLKIYERITQLDETISFLSTETSQNRLPQVLSAEIELLKQERDNILKNELSAKEYEFIKEYGGIVQRLRQN